MHPKKDAPNKLYLMTALDRLPDAAAVVTIFFSLTTFLGWVFSISWLKTFPAGVTAMNPLTAINFTLCALCLYLLKRGPASSFQVQIVKGASAAIMILAGNRILGFFGFDLPLDRLLFMSELGSNQMAPNTAFCFALIGISLYLLTHADIRVRLRKDYTNTCGFAISLLTLTGYLYGTEQLYGVSTFIPMALNTGICFFALTVGIFALRPNEGLTALYTAQDLGGATLRRLLPIVILTPLILGGFRIYGQRRGWYEFEFGASLLVAGTVIVLGFLTWKCAKYLSQVDQAFKNQSRLLQSILTSIADGVVVLDSDEKISNFNRSAADILNLGLYIRDQKQWEQQSALALVTGSSHIPITLQQVLHEPGDSGLMLKVPSGDGFEDRFLSVVTRPMIDSSGDGFGQVSVFRDITEMKNAEKVLKKNNEELESRISERLGELEEARTQIEQLQKLDAIGRLAGGIAHDFNNILGAIQMYCELIAIKAANAEAVREVAGDIERATARGATLTKQLLIFSRKKITEPQVIRLNDLIPEHFKMLKRLIGENISIHFDLAKDLPTIYADVGQIEQVVMNLVLNARDAMADGGKMTLQTRYEKSRVLLEVTDTGCGMSEETKKRIFEPFFTTKPIGKGTGLGLSTVYGIVKALEGEVEVQSEVGKGTTFKVFIPSSSPWIAQPEQPVIAPVRQGKETILIVEDEVHLRTLYGQSLEQRGYKVILAENGKSALEQIEVYGSEIELVITDMLMPEMGGHALVQEIIARGLPIQILCMSGYPGDDVELQAMGNGQIGYLQKPFKTSDLLAKVQGLLDDRPQNQSKLAGSA